MRCTSSACRCTRLTHGERGAWGDAPQFAVIDNEILLNGSFNWTRHAVLGNQENVVVYRDPMLCRKFVAEFERLWLKFAASRNRV